MKIEIQENESKEKFKYPCLMISEIKQIVLMTGSCEGTIISPGKAPGQEIGEFSNSWHMPAFKPFTGRIILEND
jgi:hypothetical protein